MAHRALTVLLAVLALIVNASSHAALAPYSQNFESLVLTSPTALSADAWWVYGNVFDPTGMTWLYGYGPYPAPNDGAEPLDGYAFCGIVAGQGGTAQGNQQLSVYSDYNNVGAHTAGQRVESNVFHEQTIVAGDVGKRWLFAFDAKPGNLTGSSTALAFIKTLSPPTYALTNFKQVNMTSIAATWSTYWLAITIDPSLAGQILQFGFLNNATSSQGSSIYYDNVSWAENYVTGVDGSAQKGPDQLMAAPNPFSTFTRVTYSIARRGAVDLGVYDISGRRVAVLFRGEAAPGSHVATWNGRTSDGRLAPTGVYRCVLQTAEGRHTRSVVISR
ncbi:MAG TPA: FlgD immunoglobulin-like domain containing protein [Candidatus Eisenbacteria bacterium]|nr:FlgD immunoglobulin-like domain containing protein [Candidatus Eisenbacteria bacterium]